MADSFWEERTGWRSLRAAIAERISRSSPNASWGVTLGSVIAFLVLVQIATGVLLSLYYEPSLEGAHASVKELVHEIPMGWFYRGIHVWGSHLLVAVTLLHLIRTFVHGTFQRPREIVWGSGVILLVVLLAAAFTGQSLPMGEDGFNGMLVATGLASEVPVAGEMVTGGDYVDQRTITRIHAVHLVFLPLVLLLLIVGHGALVSRLGISPRGGTKRPMAARTGIAILVTLALLVTLVVIAPPGVGDAYDANKEASAELKPGWAFLPAYQLLKFTDGWIEPWLGLFPFLLLLLLPWFKPFFARVVFYGGLASALALGIWGALS